jgi:FAD/FMN-containing dehydrogenase
MNELPAPGGGGGRLRDTDFAELRRRLSGEVMAPGSAAYEQARKPPVARFHGSWPQAVVLCADPGDVAETLTWARRLRVPIAPRSGGHCAAGRSSTDGIVIDVTPMQAVSVSRETATVGAGIRLGELYDRLHQHGLALPGGCGDTVGIAGLTLGGGIGILGRRYGLTCDQLRAAEIVLADGRIVDCDERRHGDLFWALRGAGGGQFGIVTSLVFRVVRAPPATALHLTWPYRDAEAIIAAWQRWAPEAPDEVNASLRLVNGGGPPAVLLFGAALTDEAAAMALLEELIAGYGREPASASLAELPYPDAKRALSGPDEQPKLMWSKSEFFRRSLPLPAIATLLQTFTTPRPPPHESRELAFTPLGGAYARLPASATAFVHRRERFLLEHTVTLAAETPPASHADAHAWTTRSWECVHPWASGGVYPNFPDPDLIDWAEAYHGSNYPRLLAIKRDYDPEDVFGFPQSLRSSPVGAA